MRTIYAGLDVGSTFCEVVGKRKDGERVVQRRFPTNESEIRRVVEETPGRWRVNLEACELSRWVAGVLRKLPQVERVVVSNPKTNAWVAHDPNKCDGRDAEKLCDQLRLDVVDEVYCGEDRDRETFKDVVRHYDDLVGETQRLMCKIKSRYRIQGVIVRGAAVFTPEGREAGLARVESPAGREAIRHVYGLLDQTRKARKMAFRLMASQARKFQEIGLFKKVPGVKTVLACRYSAYVQTPFRFSNKRKLIRYCRLGISKRTSDGKSLGYERLDANGVGRLKDVSRKAFMAAVEKSKKDNAFKRAYRATLSRTQNPTHARLTVQRKIMTTLWAMWKGGTRYQDDKG